MNTAEQFYRFVLKTLQQSQIPFLVGGNHAFGPYTGIIRDTKDLDIFVYRKDCKRVVDMFAEMGFQTEIHFVHWIGKIYSGDHVVDLIFNSGNGICEVDQSWFDHAQEGLVLDLPVKLCPPEEIIWQKAFIMEHLRYDGADIAHIIYSRSADLNWERLLGRFGSHWRVLLSHLILFGFVYPNERNKIPKAVMHDLLEKLRQELDTATNEETLCQGTFLSLLEYLPDLKKSYQDARLKPTGNMSQEEIEQMTHAFIYPGRPRVSGQESGKNSV